MKSDKIYVMNKFKKKTITLVFASVISVVGVFASTNYKNTLTGIELSSTSENALNVNVQTKRAHSNPISLIRKDANTYIITLPDINSEAVSPDLSKVLSIVQSVNIRTMPSSNTANGYTRITIKILNPSTVISTSNQVFIPQKEDSELGLDKEDDSSIQAKNLVHNSSRKIPSAEYLKNKNSNTHDQPNIRRFSQGSRISSSEEKKSNSDLENSNPKENLIEKPIEKSVEEVAEENIDQDINQTIDQTKDVSNVLYVFLWSMLIILVSLFFYQRARRKIVEISGESLDIVLDTEEKTKTTTKKIKKIKTAVNTLDATYSKDSVYNKLDIKNDSNEDLNSFKKENVSEVIDLDVIFKEHLVSIKEEEENRALEEFLSGFSFNESLEEEADINERYFDEEFYKSTINNTSLKFSKDDILKIGELLKTEIQDEIIKDIKKHTVSNPIQSEKTNKDFVEKFVLEYSLSRNTTFTSEDISILRKLMSVELDSDFITDLRTSPKRTIQMEEEILLNGDKYKKPSEIITLKVSDMLPDLSEKLKEQGTERKEYAKKTDVVYIKEGYDVKTLAIKDELPDLSIEKNQGKEYLAKPQPVYKIVDADYAVGDKELNILEEFPDFANIMLNAEKYNTKKEEFVEIDEEAFLKSILEAQIKPFYDEDARDDVFDEIPTVIDIKEEMKQFEGFEIFASEDEISLNHNSYFPSKTIEAEKNIDLNKLLKVENVENVSINKKEIKTEVLSQKVEKTAKISNSVEKKNIQKKDLVNSNMNETLKFVVDGEIFTVLSSVEIEKNKGCYLTKNQKGYTVFGYVGEKLLKIHYYDDLKSEKIQARLNEKFENGNSRYMIRIGTQKFIILILENDIKFIMDLC